MYYTIGFKTYRRLIREQESSFWPDNSLHAKEYDRDRFEQRRRWGLID